MKPDKFKFSMHLPLILAALSVLVILAVSQSDWLSALTTSINDNQRISAAEPNNPAAQQQATQSGIEQISESYGKTEIAFEENRGQTDKAVDFLARGAGYTLFLKADEAVFSLSQQSQSQKSKENSLNELSKRNPNVKQKSKSTSAVLRMEIVGANKQAEGAAEKETESKVNYLKGKDSDKWLSGVSTFSKVRYREIYPGVDLVYYGNQRQLEYDFEVSPEADYRKVSLKFKGADKLEVEKETGDLLLKVGNQTVRQKKPFVYQETETGERREIASRYLIKRDKQVGFELIEEYDRKQPLVIDPVLVYSTFLGGSSYDGGFKIAVDTSGNAYVTGQIGSTDFPTTSGAFDTTFNGYYDIFVTKLNASGTSLLYSTYLGGSGYEYSWGIAVDSSGNAYLTGNTDSTDFPTTSGAFDTTLNGGGDAFVTKLNSSGASLLYSTFLGGSDYETGLGIAVDSSGNAYVTGQINSTNFPTTSGAFDTTFNDSYDAFVTKLNASGTGLLYSTYLGGSNYEYAYGIAVDSSGNAYVTGQTYSTNFPTTSGAFDTTLNGGDVFVTKLNSSGASLLYSTFLGGSNYEGGDGIAVDSSGNAYVTGQTSSTDFPTTSGAFDTTHNSGGDAFVTKLNASGASLLYSTYLGGSDYEEGWGIAVDSSGNAYVAGYTYSTDFPTTSDAFDTTFNGSSDVFVTKLNASGASLLYSTYLGGINYEFNYGIAVDSSGNAYVTGEVLSTNFPTTSGAFDTTHNGNYDAFVAKIATVSTPDLSVSMIVTPDPVNPGADLTYQITITNSGGEAQNIVLRQTDYFWRGNNSRLGIRSISAPPGFTCGMWNPLSGGQFADVVCEGASIGAGATLEFTIVKFQRQPYPSGKVINHTAEVSTTSEESDYTNNTATDSTRIK
jgi:hypothetical protein